MYCQGSHGKIGFIILVVLLAEGNWTNFRSHLVSSREHLRHLMIPTGTFKKWLPALVNESAFQIYSQASTTCWNVKGKMNPLTGHYVTCLLPIHSKSHYGLAGSNIYHLCFKDPSNVWNISEQVYSFPRKQKQINIGPLLDPGSLKVISVFILYLDIYMG